MAVTDLTGTKWLFKVVSNDLNDNPPGSEVTLDCSGVITNQHSDTLNFTYIINYDNVFLDFYNGSGDYFTFVDSGIGYFNGDDAELGDYIIEITGGTDATNADLIAWLQANATQIQDESNPISFGNLPIANMYFGTQQVKKVYLGNTLVWEKEATIIEFSIGTSSYQAEEGMTWGEWVNSEYNTGRFYITSDNIGVSGRIIGGNTLSDTIIAGGEYTLIVGGGGSD